MSGIEEKLKELTGIVFNNWYALKIALEHGLGGPPTVQHGKVETLLNSIVSMTVRLPQNGDIGDISDFVLDFMDDEFSVVLEDNSQVDITQEVYNFYQLLHAGSEGEVMNKLEKLPEKTSILTRSFSAGSRKARVQESDDSDDSDDDDAMEQDDPDPGWTVVKHKHK